MLQEERRDSVAILRMQKGKVNALDLELLAALRTKLEAIDREIKAVVLTGAGSCFSAGVDLFRVLDGGREYLERLLPLRSGHRPRFIRPFVPISTKRLAATKENERGRFLITWRIYEPHPRVALCLLCHRI